MSSIWFIEKEETGFPRTKLTFISRTRRDLAFTSPATGIHAVGSSGSVAQMVFIPTYTNTAVFIGIDNYHVNYGGPGYDLVTATHSKTSYMYASTTTSVFGIEYNLISNTIHPVKPIYNSSARLVLSSLMVHF
jgi:hypothetical protein